jgi:hypothetical protein
MIEPPSFPPHRGPRFPVRDATRDTWPYGNNTAPETMSGNHAAGETTTDIVAQLHTLAIQVLGRHLAIDGLCQQCGAAWPCVNCVRAAQALELQ